MITADKLMGAYLSRDRLYRYVLWRVLDAADINRLVVVFIGVNPSTANEKRNDPTITKMVNFACGRDASLFIALNLFAFRATQPGDMKAQDCPVGEEQWWYWHQVFKHYPDALYIAGWGNNGEYLDRDRRVMTWFRRAGIQPLRFKLTQSGSPYHPLYISLKKTKPFYGRE